MTRNGMATIVEGLCDWGVRVCGVLCIFGFVLVVRDCALPAPAQTWPAPTMGMWVDIAMSPRAGVVAAPMAGGNGWGGDTYYYSEGGTNFKSHVFSQGQTFYVSDGALACGVLCVGGGGGGGQGVGGGGGGGGCVYSSAVSFAVGSYAVTIGTGGMAAAGAGGNGGNSLITGIMTAQGGGGGGGQVNPGKNGGAGGGGCYTMSGGTGIVSQGYNGGTGGPASGAYPAGGGGGAGGLGGNYLGVTAGAGGIGTMSSLKYGTNEYFGGGGGGGYNVNGTNGAGGLGGGAIGGPNAGAFATGGGGGGGSGSAAYIGGRGGSGIVVIRYQVPASEWPWTQYPTYDLLAHYRFETNWLDSVTGVTGTNITFSVFTNDCRLGASAAFFNTNYMQAINKALLQGQNGFTLSAWIKKVTDVSLAGLITSRGTQLTALGFNVAGTAIDFYEISASVLSSATALSTGTWYHVVGTWRSWDGDMRLYINGVLNTNGIKGAGTLAVQDDYFKIPFDDDGAASIANAAVDEVAIWGRALSSNEVWQLYGVTNK